jgi:hypothetical protein
MIRLDYSHVDESNAGKIAHEPYLIVAVNAAVVDWFLKSTWAQGMMKNEWKSSHYTTCTTSCMSTSTYSTRNEVCCVASQPSRSVVVHTKCGGSERMQIILLQLPE